MGSWRPPTYSLCTWTSSGAFTNVYTVTHPIEYVWGDNAGQIVARQQGSLYVWNGTTYAETGNSNLNYPTYPGYVSSGGLVCGYNATVTESWAYDLNTSTYYSVSTSSEGDTWATGANDGYVVGSTNGVGYLWKESNQSYSTFSGTSGLNGVSENGQYIAAVTTGGQAALYSTSGTLLGSYWNGEATFVNDSGLVVGDTTTIDGGGGNSDPRAMAYLDGNTVDLTTAYAPAGVTFRACDGVNDAGQIWCVELLQRRHRRRDVALDARPARRRQPRRQSGHQRLDHRTGPLRPDRHELDPGRIYRRRHGGHQRLDHRAGELQPDRRFRSAAGMSAVPEPGTVGLLIAGMGGLLACAWKRHG